LIPNYLQRTTIRLQIPDKKVILITGNYGSGKTEVAVNYASWLAREGQKVQIADLDLVNPYFRCREATEPLEALGIKVVAPAGDYHSADLPILLPQVRGIIEQPKDFTILDVGGDNVGSTVLAALTPAFERTNYEMIFVVNRNRPFTDTLDGCLRIISEIQAASRLRVSAIAGNTHLMDETTPETIQAGMELTEDVAKALKLPVAFLSVERHVLQTMDETSIPYPILPLERLLLPPWRQKATTSTTHSRDGFGKLTAGSKEPGFPRSRE
jgi:energy-coupling factor transporter ATP-binding protein EcfA2